MTGRSPALVRAAVPQLDRETIAARAPAAEVVEIEALPDLSVLDFIVPVPDGQGQIVERLAGLERLAVIQTLSAGVDTLAGRVPPHVTLCSARGARDDSVAEWVLGALLSVPSRIVAQHGVRHWDRVERDEDLHGSTVLIVGMGSIGGRVAESSPRSARARSASSPAPGTACTGSMSSTRCSPAPTRSCCSPRSPTRRAG